MGGGGAGWLIESVARRKEKQFVVLPRRWVSGADFCLVGVVWAVEQGLPGSATEQRSFDLHCHDASHAGQAVIGMKVSVTTSPGGTWGSWRNCPLRSAVLTAKLCQAPLLSQVAFAQGSAVNRKRLAVAFGTDALCAGQRR